MKFGKIAAVGLAGGMALGATAAADDFRTAVRAVDGSNNNLSHPDWGTPGYHLKREASGAHYADGISAKARPNGPSARAVSNAIFAQTTDRKNHLGYSDFIWVFGQFLDHDFALTEGNPFDGLTDSFIGIPQFDAFFDPFGSGTQQMSFHRGMFDPNTGTSTSNPRQQINEITGYIDGSNVYGSDNARLAALRSGTGGAMKVVHTAVGDLLPFNDGTVGNAGSPERPDLSTSLFLAGDIRVNETPTLAVMHTLFVRNHNWHAAKFAAKHPDWTDEQVFQAARRMNIAEIQHIVFDEFFPTLIGNAIGAGPYLGYSSSINASQASIFSTAAYRVGHTLLSTNVQRLNEDGTSVPEGPLLLRDGFFAAAPPILQAHGIEVFLRGAASQKAQELDHFVIDDVRNFLFGAPGAGGLDLISLNIQRGRDMGLGDFNTVRADFGLPKYTSFNQISKDPAVNAALSQVYGGDINAIDPFAGMFAEGHVPGFNVGSTLLAVYMNQFTRSRAGDRFWYERILSSSELSTVKATRFSDIIKRNTGIHNIQSTVFYVPGHSQPLFDPGVPGL